MIHGILLGSGLCLAPVILAGLLRGWHWIFAGLLMLVALAVLVIVHATGLADWRLVGPAWLIGSGLCLFALPMAGFDWLRSALFVNAGLVAVSVWLVQHTIDAGS